ncbi:MAG: glycerate kinase, partial [Anaerolineae bacterium]|nr:glycerate kinase [Anaerolineae bacterium]
MLQPKRQLSDTERKRRDQVWDILSAALAAVDPAQAIRQNVRLEEDNLQIGQRSYDLSGYKRIFVAGGGKAGSPMVAAIEETLGQRITAGLVNVKHGYLPPEAADVQRVEIVEAGHPTPDEAGRRGAERMVEMLSDLTEKDLVICLISGGGSALMTLPQPTISLADVQALTGALLRCGATINEINAVRKHISRIKGGQLARLIHPAQVVSLILSDVVGNPLDVIASGPTVPDTTTFAQAYGVLEKYDLLDKVPASIVEHLAAGVAGKMAETPKEGETVFATVYNLIVGSNEIAAWAALSRARELGFNTQLLSTYVEGEAREVAKVLAAIAKEMAQSGWPIPRPACLVVGGETTVTIAGEGKGGRNQEMALAAALAIQGWEDVMVVTLATDGTDGPTDAAGGIATGETIAWARELGLHPERYLADNDSYHFFEALGELIVTGPTNTNVTTWLLSLPSEVVIHEN